MCGGHLLPSAHVQHLALLISVERFIVTEEHSEGERALVEQRRINWEMAAQTTDIRDGKASQQQHMR